MARRSALGFSNLGTECRAAICVGAGRGNLINMVDAVLTSEFRPIDAEASCETASRETFARNDDAADSWLDVTSRMAHGDRDAFRDYYDRFFRLMLAESKRCTGRDEQTCWDIVHDAMVKAIHSMKPIANHRALTTWSKLLVRSVAYDWLRREQRQKSLRLATDPNHWVDCELEPAANVAIDDQARIHWLEQSIRQFPAELQRIIDWRYRFGWTLRRIGLQLGLKPGAVDGRLRRAIDELRNLAELETDE